MARVTSAPPGMRWRIPIVLAVTVFVNYLDRNNLALALPQIAQDFGWSNQQVGAYGEWLLAAFFLSYALANIGLSPWAERFGPKRSIILALIAFSVFTMLSAPLGQSITALVILRLLLGFGEGVHIPMLSAMTSRWFPSQERSRANAIWGVGISLAIATAPLLVVPLIQAIGWRSTFAVIGVVGLLISVPLVWVGVADDPSQVDTLSQAERLHIQAGQIPLQSMTLPTANAAYWRDRRFWWVVLGGILNAFCAFGILNWLPTYFNRAKGIDFDQLGWPLALVFTAGIVGMGVMAYWGDRWQHRARLASGGFFLAAVMVYVASHMTAVTPLVLCFAIAVFCQSAYGAQEYAIVQRLLPADQVGSGTGLYNGLSVLVGGVGGSLIPGTVIAMTGSLDAGILSVVIGAFLAALILLGVGYLVRY